MRIGEVNLQNYQSVLRMFQNLNGNQKNSTDLLSSLASGGFTEKNATVGMVEVAPGYFCQNDPTIIANFRKNFDADGDLINPVNGLAGLDVTGKKPSEYQKLINISDGIRQEMFNTVKSEFINENGVLNGDTTKRSDVYTDCYKGVAKADRLKAEYTLGQYERAYRQACIAAVQSSDPSWEIGQPFDSRILDSVTRESIESMLVKQGNTLVRKSIDYTI